MGNTGLYYHDVRYVDVWISVLLHGKKEKIVLVTKNAAMISFALSGALL